MREEMFRTYPPDEKHKYLHYKNGIRAWKSYHWLKRLSVTMSFISVLISLVALVVVLAIRV